MMVFHHPEDGRYSKQPIYTQSVGTALSISKTSIILHCEITKKNFKINYHRKHILPNVRALF